MNDKVVVTVKMDEQVGYDRYETQSKSRVFLVDSSLKEMLSFAEEMGFVDPTINDLHFSELTPTPLRVNK